MSLDLDQLRTHIIVPVHQYLSPVIPYSPAADNMVLGTIMTESRGVYIKQVGKGPALGLAQMEPVTHDDIWINYISKNPKLSRLVTDLMTPASITAGALEMIGNHYYSIAMCRIFYRRLPDALPQADDAMGMAQLWKKRYNTYLGAGTVEKALPYFRKACGV